LKNNTLREPIIRRNISQNRKKCKINEHFFRIALSISHDAGNQLRFLTLLANSCFIRQVAQHLHCVSNDRITNKYTNSLSLVVFLN